MVDVNQAHLTLRYAPYYNLVYTAWSADVRHVMVAGRWLLKDRRLLTLDWGDIASRARNYAQDLAAFAAASQP